MAKRNVKQTEVAQAVAKATAPTSADVQPSGPVTQIAVTLADNTVGALRADGAAAQDYDASVQNFANLFAKVSHRDAKHPGNFALYIPMRTQWLVGYDASARGMTDAASIEKLVEGERTEAARKAFDRRWKAAQTLGLIGERPSSAEPASVAKQEKREAAKKAAEAKQAELAKVNVEATKAAMVKAAAAGDVAKVAELAKLASDATEAADKVAKAAADAQWKKSVAAFDERVKAIRASHDVKLIGAAYAALAKFVPAKATAKATAKA